MTLSRSTMLTVFILFETVKGGNSSSDPLINIAKLQALDLWRLQMEWTVNRSEDQRNQTYEIQVGRSTNMDIVDSMRVSGGSLSVVWSSQLPLSCVDHSVRVRLVSDASTFSSWSPWVTNYGESLDNSKVRLFPDDQVLREGSTVMFCCIFPSDTNITSLFFGNNAYNVINISPRVKAIKVENIKATNTYGINFYCKESSDLVKNFVTFPPEKPQDFRCETEDVRKICCSWIIYRSPNLNGRHGRKYTLLINDSTVVSCKVKGTRSPSCCFKVVPQQITYNVTLLVTNGLGRESQTDIFSIRDRVFPVPERPEVTAGAFDSVMILQLNGLFEGFPLICQIELDPGGTKQDFDKNGSDSVQHYTFRLQHLKPSTPYSIRGRCAVRGNQWGRWTPQTSFITQPLVTVNLWRQIREHPTRTVTLKWETVSSESELNIKAYEVCVNSSSPQRSVCMNVTQKQVELSIDVYVCDISVRAVVTQSGSSVRSRITIPSVYTYNKSKASAQSSLKRIMGNEKGFQLTWTRDSASTCDYIVEWCKLGIGPPCDLEWRNVPANQTFLNINAADFKAGVQYMFTIYGCSAEGHRPHEKQIGYLKEQKPIQFPTLDSNPDVTGSSVKLKWSFSEDDPSHTGFITGYVITVHDDSKAGSYHNSYSQSLNDPHSKSFTVSGLEEDQPYTFDLAACTSAGCGPKTTATFRTTKNYCLLVLKIMIPLLVLFGCCFCLWSNRNMVKGFPEEKFSFLHNKALNLDEELYEASEKIHNLRMEDCEWCDVEILDVWPDAAGKTRFTSAEGAKVTFPSFMTPSGHLTADIWTATGLTNFTYLSSVPSEEPEPDTTKQQTEIAGLSSDYVTSVTM